MRARSIRFLIFVVLLVGLAVASLAFREINLDLPGLPALERGGTGPLGLKLGLDLRGGGHLVYQADTGTTIDMQFTNPATGVTTATLEDALRGLNLGELQVTRSDTQSFQVKTTLLSNEQREAVRAALEQNVGPISTFESETIEEATDDQMEGALNIIRRRVNLFGTEEPIIQRFGDDRIIVQLPGASGTITDVTFSAPVAIETAQSIVTGLGYTDAEIERQGESSYRIRTTSLDNAKRQELRNALDAGVDTPEQQISISNFQSTGGIETAKALIGQTARLEFKERTCSDPNCTEFTDSDLGLTGDDLADAFATTDPSGQWVVSIQFNGRGAEIFSDLTRRISGVQTKRIAIFLDDEEVIAPVSLAWIRDGASVISGNFTREEARALAIQLDSGRLPVPLRLVEESEVDALLGEASLRQSLVAGLLGLAVVMTFMVLYYRAAGLVASVALLVYAILVLSIFKLIPVTLTLAHIAGFILSIGMAVDANVLIFERMKEEIRIGRTLSSAMEVGFSRAWPAIRDSNVSTIITTLILLWFGNRLGGELVTGFALTLFIGVVVSMFTALVVSRHLLQLLGWIGLGRAVSLFTPERVQRSAQPARR